MIILKDLNFSYPENKILSDVNLQITEGELHAIVGPNGAGKSTLLRLISGLIEADSGEVIVNSKKISEMDPQKIAKLIAFVFQENYTGFPFSVNEIVLMGRHPHQDSVLFDTEKDKEIANNALKILEIEHLRDRMFRTLSGGEKQRVAIAAALTQDSPVILFDEPTAFTDIRYKTEIFNLIHTISKEKKLTSLVVTHDVNMASLYCDKVTILNNKKIIASGKPNDVFTESLLSKTFNIPVKVINHPEENVPIIIPVLKK